MTGVIVRSSANVQAGGRTRLSAVLHGVWLLVFVVALSGVLQLIPTASLAAVLVFTGYKLVDSKAIRKLAEAGRGELVIYFATLVTIVVEDLLTGVLVGVALAAAKLLYTFSHLKIRVEQDSHGHKVNLYLEGAATFIRLPKLAAALDGLPEDAELHVDLAGLSYIDHACLELLTTWAHRHERAGGRLVIDWESLHATFRGGARRSTPTSTPRRDLASTVTARSSANILRVGDAPSLVRSGMMAASRPCFSAPPIACPRCESPATPVCSPL